MTSDDYREGLKDGLREALAVLSTEEGKWAERMTRPSKGRTLRAQTVRAQAFKTAQVRVRTVLRKLEREDARGIRPAPLEDKLGKLGLV